MKIKDIVTEGIWDKIKGYAQTGKTGWQAAAGKEKGQKEFDQYLNIMNRKWNEYQGQTGDDDIVKWASRFFKTNKINIQPGANDPASQRNFLAGVLQMYKKGELDTAPQPPQPAQGTTPQQPDTPEDNQIKWNPYKNLLTIDGMDFQLTRKGWVDFNTKELIDPKDSKELETAFDKVTGRRPVNVTV